MFGKTPGTYTVTGETSTLCVKDDNESTFPVLRQLLTGVRPKLNFKGLGPGRGLSLVRLFSKSRRDPGARSFLGCTYFIPSSHRPGTSVPVLLGSGVRVTRTTPL